MSYYKYTNNELVFPKCICLSGRLALAATAHNSIMQAGRHIRIKGDSIDFDTKSRT